MAKAKKDSIPPEYDDHFKGSTPEDIMRYGEATRYYGEPITKKKKKKGWVKRRVENVKAVDEYFGEKWKTRDLKKRIKKMKAKGAAKRKARRKRMGG